VKGRRGNAAHSTVSTKFRFLPPASFQVFSSDWARMVLTEDRTLEAESLDIVDRGLDG